MGDVERIRSELTRAGLAGVAELGRFVNDTTHLSPSMFDERAAMPTLLRLLPSLTDPYAIELTAGHLARPWAKPLAFGPLHDVFVARAADDYQLGWTVGAALAAVADSGCGAAVVELAFDPRYGWGRQELVDATWRFKSHPAVVPGLRLAIGDPDVALHAMSALRRAVGNDAALADLDRVAADHADPKVRDNARRAAERARKAIERSNKRPRS